MDSSEESTRWVSQKLLEHLDQALETEDTDMKDYHIRSAQQYVFILESLTADTGPPPSNS
jgi:hypothetical protein